MRAARFQLFACAVVLGLAACTSSGPSAQIGSRAAPSGNTAAGPQGGPVIYAALGASETVGVGVPDRLRQAWPQLFFITALPQDAVFVNFGVPGATTAEALDEQLPAALAIHPTVVTIWLNVNDLIAAVPPDVYEAQLRRLVDAFRQVRTPRILIANTPYLDRLPAYLACLAPVGSTLHCPIKPPVPSPAELDAEVDAYNAAIARVVHDEAAILVDLHGQGEVPDRHPDWISSDGFHPNARGYAAIASAFQTAFSS